MARSSSLASLWQPSQPIFAAGFAYFLGWEEMTPLKLSGLILGFGGAGCMVALGTSVEGGFYANVCFFLNCIAMCLYVLAAKKLYTRSYSSSMVTAWSYSLAVLCMSLSLVIVNSNPTLLSVLCKDCVGAWAVPTETIWALAYWIIFQSLVCFMLLTWANQFVNVSISQLYVIIQPLIAAVIAAILNAFGVPKMDKLGMQDVGAVGIVIGLVLVLYSNYHEEEAAKLNCLLSVSETESERDDERPNNSQMRNQNQARPGFEADKTDREVVLDG